MSRRDFNKSKQYTKTEVDALKVNMAKSLKNLNNLTTTIYMRNGIDTTNVLVTSNTIEFTTNTTYGNAGFAVANTLGNKYIAVTTIKNIGIVNAPILKRQLAYNNSPSASSAITTNTIQIGVNSALNVGQNATFIDEFTSDNGSNTAIALAVMTATSGVRLKVTQKIYDVTSFSDDIRGMQIKSSKSDFSDISQLAYGLEDTYLQLIVDYYANAINCWGDSLTRGVGGTIPYPQTLATLTGKTVYNMGIGGEVATQIAARQGGLPVWINNITIPSTATAVQVGTYAASNMLDDFGNPIRTLLSGGGIHPSVNPCKIAGIEGTLAWTGSTASDANGTFTFTRTVAGTATPLTRPTMLVTYAMENRRDNITIFWVGTNDRPTSVNVGDLIYKLRSMIGFLRTRKYIVLGMTCKSYMSEVAEVNDALRKEFGCRFLDIRKYLLSYGLADAGISATAQDTTDIGNGEIPTSLRSDEVHFVDATYVIVANQAYKKLKELNYVT